MYGNVQSVLRNRKPGSFGKVQWRKCIDKTYSAALSSIVKVFVFLHALTVPDVGYYYFMQVAPPFPRDGRRAKGHE